MSRSYAVMFGKFSAGLTASISVPCFLLWLANPFEARSKRSSKTILVLSLAVIMNPGIFSYFDYREESLCKYRWSLTLFLVAIPVGDLGAASLLQSNLCSWQQEHSAYPLRSGMQAGTPVLLISQAQLTISLKGSCFMTTILYLDSICTEYET